MLCGADSTPAARAALPHEIEVDAVEDCQGSPFNFGIGQGLANAADGWTAKFIVAFSC